MKTPILSIGESCTARTGASPGCSVSGRKRPRRPAARSIAAGLGWMLDSFDVMLYALVLATLIRDLGMTHGHGRTARIADARRLRRRRALFGVLADRYGRTRALDLERPDLLRLHRRSAALRSRWRSWRSSASALGSAWAASGRAAPRSSPRRGRREHRGKALGLVQSAWAIGYGLAAIVTAIVLPRWGWRAVFFVGIVPALLTLWIRRRVPEPAMWRQTRARPGRPNAWRFADIFRGRVGRLTLDGHPDERVHHVRVVGIQSLDPGVSLAAAGAGRHRPEHRRAMAGLVVAMQVGMWLGYVTFGFVSDALGRKRTYVAYLVSAAALVLRVRFDARSAGCCSCSDRSSRSSAPATSAASAR